MAVESNRRRNRDEKRDTDHRGLSDPMRRRWKAGDDYGEAIRSEPREAPNNGVVRKRRKTQLEE